MTSARSCKNPERNWFLEMLRRCKALPILIAVAYFLSNILPLLLALDRFEDIVLYAYNSMTGSNFFNMAIGIAGGIVVSCAVFRYLHSTASVIDAHSRPQTRTQLFRGSFFAGLVMIIAPVVFTGLLYLCFVGVKSSPDAVPVLEEYGLLLDAESVLVPLNIAGWVLDNIVIIGFTYCVSCLAAIIAGTAVIQALLSILLIALPSIIYLVFEGYMNMFLSGYVGGNDISGYLSPYVALFGRNDYPFREFPAALLLYSVIAALVVIAAVLIYKKIQLEKEEQTIVVPYVAGILVILLTVISVSVFLFITDSFITRSSMAGMILTVVLATAVFFPIYCMIAEQSFRIFKSRNAKTLLIYAVCMGLILAFTLFDVTGFEKRVPEVSEIESVKVEDSNLVRQRTGAITDEEAIKLVTDLHRSIVAEEASQDASAGITGEDPDKYPISIKLRYKLKNGRTLVRSYVDFGQDVAGAYAEYYACDTIRKQECYDVSDYGRPGQYMAVYDVHVDRNGDNNGDIFMVPEQDQKGLVKAANKDIMKWTVESRQVFAGNEEYDPAKDDSAYAIEVSTDGRLPQEKIQKLENISSYFLFTEKDKNVNRFIKEHPEITSDENRLDPDDPIFGNND